MPLQIINDTDTSRQENQEAHESSDPPQVKLEQDAGLYAKHSRNSRAESVGTAPV